MTDTPLPALPDDFEPTRATLHAYAKALSTLPQTHLPKHPKWWHISLDVHPRGLAIKNLALPGGGILGGRLDLVSHAVVLETSDGTLERFAVDEGRTGTEMAEALIAAVARHGLVGDYVRKDFEDDSPTTYEPSFASTYWRAVTTSAAVFERHRAALSGVVGPVQFWSHGFDLAVEWFGTRQVEYGGEQLPAQINLGFYATGHPYFYSNPWPMDDALLAGRAPGAGRWCEEPFRGSILEYAMVAGRPDAPDIVADYAAAVHAAASPSLLAN